MTRIEAARDVAQALNLAEDALDAAIRDFARLTSRLVEARGEMGLSSTVGADVALRLAAVQSGLAGSRAEAAAVHTALGDVKDRIGLRSVAVGVGDKTDEAPVTFRDDAVVRTLRAG